MIRDDQLTRLVDNLARRQVSLWHACQLVDFVSYLRIDGIPSRAALEARQLSFTPFATDDKDQDRQVWDKIFVNLSDFGTRFASGQEYTPTAYGPIMLRVRPAALRLAADVAVCLRSAGEPGFKRNTEALKSVDEVDTLFSVPLSQVKEQPQSPLGLVVTPTSYAGLKSKNQLRLEFPERVVEWPEVSCTFSAGTLPLRYVEHVIVDPYPRLSEIVEQVSARFQFDATVAERQPNRWALGQESEQQSAMYQELWDCFAAGKRSLDEIINRDHASARLREWAVAIQSTGLRWMFDRYTTYLWTGTIEPLWRIGLA